MKTVHFRFALRQVRRSSRQSALFVLCIVLSLSTITAFSGFSESVNRSLLSDARKLQGADIIVRSDRSISDAMRRAIEGLVNRRAVHRTHYHEFYSVVRRLDDAASALAELKIVERQYPFYGRVMLKSGRSLHEALRRGNVVVAQNLLDRLGISVGDVIKVGFATLAVADVITSEPDRPIDFFSLGPRVFVSQEDRDALGLIQTGSRIKYAVLLKVADPRKVDELADQLSKAAAEEGERVETFRTARSRIARFLNNFLFFLQLVGLFIVIIAGFGIQGTLSAFLDERKTTVAILKTLGASTRYIITHFMLIVFILGFLGTVAGIGLGVVIQRALEWGLASFLTSRPEASLSFKGIVEGVLTGGLTAAYFSFSPLYRLRESRPLTIFRQETPMYRHGLPHVVATILFLFAFGIMMLWHMGDLVFGASFLAAMIGLIFTVFLLSQLSLAWLNRIKVSNLWVRQSFKGLFRKGNATRATIVTLAASLSVVFAIFLIEQNLNATYVHSYPPGAPNLFFVDIQPDQLDGFLEVVGKKCETYPIVRARLASINGKPINRKEDRSRRGDRLTRVFSLTYRDHLLDDEEIVSGKGLFYPEWREPQVSVLDTVVEMRKIRIGDRLVFNVQWVPLTARVASIRGRKRETISPYFYFVLQESVLKHAPQTRFSALRVPPEEGIALQNRVVARFPNISAIDVSQAIKVFAGLVEKLSGVIRFFTSLSITAGLLILVSAVYATRNQRTIESVYYKILGARQSFVFRVFALENVMIGLVSSILALIVSQVGAFLVCKYQLSIEYRFFPLPSLMMGSVAVIVVTAMGTGAAKPIFDKKPAAFLREQGDSP